MSHGADSSTLLSTPTQRLEINNDLITIHLCVSADDDVSVLIAKLRQLVTYAPFEAYRKVQLVVGCFPYSPNAIDCP